MHNFLSPKVLLSPWLAWLCLAQNAMAVLCLCLSQAWGSSAGLLAPDQVPCVSVPCRLLERMTAVWQEGEVLVSGYEPLCDHTAWQIPPAFKLWLAVTQADTAGSVMLQKILWKSWPNSRGRDPKQYPLPPGICPACPVAGQPGTTTSMHSTARGLAAWAGPKLLSSISDLEMHGFMHSTWEAVKVTRMWTVLWSDIEVYYGRQGSRRVYVRGLGGFLLSASSWLLWGSFFISRLFVFWKLLQYSFKTETRSELCEASRKIYLNFVKC